MSDESSFTEFMRRIRAGDEQAAAELVQKYEPLIRRQIRLQLEDRRLCRLFDSMDVCQSVLKSFFFRTAAGQYDLETPEDLQRLLVTIALEAARTGEAKQLLQEWAKGADAALLTEEAKASLARLTGR